MTGPEKGDFLIQVTAWAGLIVCTFSESIRYIRMSFSLPVLQRVRINFIFTDSVCILCLSYSIKKSKSTAKFYQKKEQKQTLS
jgi:hypothetical protein